MLDGNGDVEVTGIAYDSRRVAAGDVFVAVTGIHVDGHEYLREAVRQGAVALAVERRMTVPDGVPVLHMPSTRIGLAELAAEFYGRPSRRLRLAGVTGTDGKTTVTHMSEHVLQASGIVAGAMSTVAFKVSGREIDNTTGQTTTEAPEVQAWLARMVEGGATSAVIETTSHALVQERVRACDFDVAAFTNVGHDHLDYHATWTEYLEAKARLIELTAASADKGIEKTAVLNRDDVSYERLVRWPIARRRCARPRYVVRSACRSKTWVAGSAASRACADGWSRSTSVRSSASTSTSRTRPVLSRARSRSCGLSRVAG